MIYSFEGGHIHLYVIPYFLHKKKDQIKKNNWIVYSFIFSLLNCTLRGYRYASWINYNFHGARNSIQHMDS